MARVALDQTWGALLPQDGGNGSLAVAPLPTTPPEAVDEGVKAGCRWGVKALKTRKTGLHLSFNIGRDDDVDVDGDDDEEDGVGGGEGGGRGGGGGGGGVGNYRECEKSEGAGGEGRRRREESMTKAPSSNNDGHTHSGSDTRKPNRFHEAEKAAALREEKERETSSAGALRYMRKLTRAAAAAATARDIELLRHVYAVLSEGDGNANGVGGEADPSAAGAAGVEHGGGGSLVSGGGGKGVLDKAAADIKYETLRLDEETRPVEWVDTAKGVHAMLGQLQEEARRRAGTTLIVGMDTEWADDDEGRATDMPALIQIAAEFPSSTIGNEGTSGDHGNNGGDGSGGGDGEGGGTKKQMSTHVWLVDAQAAWSPSHQNGTGHLEAVRTLLQFLFQTETDEVADVTVLGFAFDHDLDKLAALVPALRAFRAPVAKPAGGGFTAGDSLVTAGAAVGDGSGKKKLAVSDIQTVHMDLCFAGDGVRAHTPSLRRVCQEWLALTMDKTEQCSDWSRRPLLESQVVYGALDAVVLLRIERQMRARREIVSKSVDEGGIE